MQNFSTNPSKKWLTKEAFCKSLACNDINGTCENLHIKRPTSTLYLLKIPSSHSDLLQSINAYLTIQITLSVIHLPLTKSINRSSYLKANLTLHC